VEIQKEEEVVPLLVENPFHPESALDQERQVTPEKNKRFRYC
jgi:hypothetical protein